MVKNDIVEQIVEYVMEDRFTQAIMLDGAWGAGKTYFVKNILMPVLQKKSAKRIIYTSLYGVTDKEQLKQDLSMQNLLGCKFVNNINIDPKKIRSIISFVWPLLKGLLKTGSMISYIPSECANVLKNTFKMDSTQVNTFMDTINEFTFKDCVIIFDDMERCGLSLNNLYGVVSNLLEENGVKVILIANQEAIGIANISKNIEHKYALALNTTALQDDKHNKGSNSVEDIKETLIKRTKELFTEDILYKSTKEKIIGLTIAFRVVLSEVYEDVVDNIIKDKNIRRYLLEKQDVVMGIFSEKTCYNVRILIFALIAFEKFYMIIKETYSCSCSNEAFCDTLDDCKVYEAYLEKEYESILIYTVYDAIDIKLHGKSATDKLSLTDSVSDYGLFVTGINNRYVYYYRFIDDYLLSCKLDKYNINAVVWGKIKERRKREESIARENGLAYKKLEKWWLLEDNVVQKTLTELLEELRIGKYSPTYFRGIVLRLLQMEKSGFDTKYAEYINHMKRQLEEGNDKFSLEDFTVAIDDQELKTSYDKNMADIFKMFEKQNISAEIYFKKIAWNERYINMCKQERDRFIQNGKFLSYMNQEEFIEELKTAKVLELYNFIDGINAIYNFSNLRDFFQSETEVVGELVKKLEELKINSVTRTLAIKALIDKLNRINELLSPNVFFNRN